MNARGSCSASQIAIMERTEFMLAPRLQTSARHQTQCSNLEQQYEYGVANIPAIVTKAPLCADHPLWLHCGALFSRQQAGRGSHHGKAGNAGRRTRPGSVLYPHRGHRGRGERTGSHCPLYRAAWTADPRAQHGLSRDVRAQVEQGRERIRAEDFAGACRSGSLSGLRSLGVLKFFLSDPSKILKGDTLELSRCRLLDDARPVIRGDRIPLLHLARIDIRKAQGVPEWDYPAERCDDI